MAKHDDPLTIAVNTLLGDAQDAFTSDPDPAAIKESTGHLRNILTEWRAHDRRVQATVIGLLKIVCDSCPHIGATYYSDGEGGGMNPCSTCGHST